MTQRLRGRRAADARRKENFKKRTITSAERRAHGPKHRKPSTSRIPTSALQLYINAIFLVGKIKSIISVLIFRWMGIKLLNDGHVMGWTAVNEAKGSRKAHNTTRSNYL